MPLPRPAHKENKKSNGGLSSFFQLKFNTAIFRGLPAWVSRLYLGIIGWIYFFSHDEQVQAITTTLRHFRRCRPGLPKLRRFWPKVRSGIIDHYHEKLFLGFHPRLKVENFIRERVSFQGLDALHQALTQGKGVIMVTGHFGAVEFMPGALGLAGLPVTVMVHCRTPELWARLEERAGRHGMKLLDPKSKSVFFEAVEHLRQGRILLTQCDELEAWHPYPDRKIDFLGLRLGLDRSLDLLARKAGCPMFFGLVHRLGGRRYRLSMEPVTPQAASGGARLFSAACLSLLGEQIHLRPEAWYEWKKLAPMVVEQQKAAPDENSWVLPLPGEMALPHGGGA